MRERGGGVSQGLELEAVLADEAVRAMREAVASMRSDVDEDSPRCLTVDLDVDVGQLQMLLLVIHPHWTRSPYCVGLTCFLFIFDSCFVDCLQP